MAKIDMSILSMLILLPATIYVIIFIVFLYARRRFKGGIIEGVVTLIMESIGLYFLADISLFLVPSLGFVKTYMIHVILKILAMLCLAVGGLKLAVK
jgi:hypothetical protein